MSILHAIRIGLNFALIFFLCGCVVQSTQLRTLVELISEPKMDLSESNWLVKYGDYESRVYAVSASDGILFANREGDQIFFDGWILRKIRGIGNYRLNINIDESNKVRSFTKGRRIVSKHICNEWIGERNSGQIRYHQQCSGRQIYKNNILIGDNGHILTIRQIVDERHTALTLSKLN